MKKIVSSALACAMALGLSSLAFAAPAYVEGSDEKLLNTVTGFSTGKSIETDLTQIGGKVEVSFDLGDNANYYSVEIDVQENGKQLDAEYNRSKKAIILRPNIKTRTVEPEDYEIAIEVVDRKTGDTVAEGYTMNGTLVYDQLQYAESGERLHNKNGVLYDFMDGEEDVEIRVDNEISLEIPHARGIYNLHMNDERNESIDYMFSGYELQYMNFVAKPKFTSDVTVTLRAAEEEYLYEYLNGRLSKVKAEYDGQQGLRFTTRQLGTYILSDMPLVEGLVDESINLVKPEGSGSSSGKDNPTTGASEAPAALLASGLFALAAAALRKIFR
ncbi:MAG: hypothetical protein HFG27_13355 [Provencibacterium sp.]|nr:hypothetical protein [Provencibacterium sp.]